MGIRLFFQNLIFLFLEVTLAKRPSTMFGASVSRRHLSPGSNLIVEETLPKLESIIQRLSAKLEVQLV